MAADLPRKQLLQLVQTSVQQNAQPCEMREQDRCWCARSAAGAASVVRVLNYFK